jgi:hypothetical protein
VPYYLLTLTVPEALRMLFEYYPEEMYPLFFASGRAAFQSVFAKKRAVGGQAGFIAVLHTWTRRMLLHPHLHLLVPAVGLAASGCQLLYPRNEDFLVPVKALGKALKSAFQSQLREQYPELFSKVDTTVWSQDWVAHCKPVGRGRTALRYLAAYVKKTAFSEERLLGSTPDGQIRLRWKDGQDGQWKEEHLQPLELIRRWLLHVLPKGLMRIRHYGWLSPAANKAFLRIRYLLGMGSYKAPRKLNSEPLRSQCCGEILMRIGRFEALRGPPLSRKPFTA